MSTNNTAIEQEAAKYGCTIIVHNSGPLNGIYAVCKGTEERICDMNEVRSVTLTKIHEVCQRISGREIKDYWS